MANGGEFGVIGLGKMGGGLALLALERGMRVVGLSRGGAADELKKAGLVEVEALAGFREELKPPRVVLLYIPAGRAVDDILDGLTQSLEPGVLSRMGQLLLGRLDPPPSPPSGRRHRIRRRGNVRRRRRRSARRLLHGRRRARGGRASRVAAARARYGSRLRP
jgi:NAD binding domain of 6-phosphogluconate dehydrogenase